MPDSSTDDARLLLDALISTEVMILSTQGQDGLLHATPLFVAPVEGLPAPCLVFATKPSSLHGEHLGVGPASVAAGTWVPHDSFRDIRGTQLRGKAWPVTRCSDDVEAQLSAAYLKRYPMAVALLAKALLAEPKDREQLYVFALSWGKLTDNARLGMGIHREWSFPNVARELGTSGE